MRARTGATLCATCEPNRIDRARSIASGVGYGSFERRVTRRCCSGLWSLAKVSTVVWADEREVRSVRGGAETLPITPTAEAAPLRASLASDEPPSGAGGWESVEVAWRSDDRLGLRPWAS